MSMKRRIHRSLTHQINETRFVAVHDRQQSISLAKSVLNTSLIQAYINMLQTSVVASGFTFSPDVRFINNDKAVFINKIFKKEFDAFTRSCGINNESLNTLIKKALLHEAIYGEAFLVFIEENNSLKLTLVNPEYVSGTKEQYTDGVAYDYLMRPVSYLINNTPVDASKVIHFFDRSKHELRGKSVIASTYPHIKMIENLTKTFALAQLTSADLSIFIETDEFTDIDEVHKSCHEEDVLILPNGATVKTAQSNIPTTKIDEMIAVHIQDVASILGVSYNTLRKTVERSSFSGLKYAYQSDINFILAKQQHVIDNLLVPLYVHYINNHLVNNINIKKKYKLKQKITRIPNIEDYTQVNITGEYPSPIDASRDIKALEFLYNNNLVSKDIITKRILGMPFSTVESQINDETEDK